MDAPQRIGRYAIHGEIASGGMATVHLGRMTGEAGFTRTVAIKRLHPALAREPEFVDMFVDEARLVARIRHPNVAGTLDVVRAPFELLIVMEYLEGESLARVIKAVRRDADVVPVEIALAILCDALRGLEAAHDATSDAGEPLGIVHRDVSPQNLLIGSDGITRVIDFGVAKAIGRLHTTQDGTVKGKLAYMAPEQVMGKAVDRRADVFAAGVVLWEMLTLERLFAGENEGVTMYNLLGKSVPRPSELAAHVPKELDDVVLRALARAPEQRFGSAREMAIALELASVVATPRRVAEWLASHVGDTLAQRKAALQRVEQGSGAMQTAEPPVDPTLHGISGPRLAAGRRRMSTHAVIGGLVLAMLASFGLGVSRLRERTAPPKPLAASSVDGTLESPRPVATTVPTASSRADKIADNAADSGVSASVAVRPTRPSSRSSGPAKKPTPSAAALASTCRVTFVTDQEGIERPTTVCR